MSKLKKKLTGKELKSRSSRVNNGENFIRKAIERKNGFFNYDKVEYVNTNSKVIITCPKHGDFMQTPASHLAGNGCMECANEKLRRERSMGRDGFIIKATRIHGDTFGYDDVVYVNDATNVWITCRIHGNFKQMPKNHLQGKGCRLCADMANRLTTEIFIERAEIIHDYYYDYSEVEYIKTDVKVNIICPKHGVFKQTPNGHLSGNGCKACNADRMRITQDEYIDRCTKIHKGYYDYSETNYIDYRTNITIICPIHGMFTQKAGKHISGQGCMPCGFKRIADSGRLNTELFIERATIVHEGFYNYDKVVYIDSQSKVIITCPKHGDFNQRPSSHLQGQGCSSCRESRGEKRVAEYLDNKKIEYEREYRIDGYNYRYDFHLPDYNLLVEYDGEQHFKVTGYFGGRKKLEETQRRDKVKGILAKDNAYNLLRIKYIDYDRIEEILDKELVCKVKERRG